MSQQQGNASYFSPPHNEELEQVVLGALLSEPRSALSVLDLLGGHHFYKSVHRDIYEAILALAYEEKEIDLVTISEQLLRSKKLDSVGGRAYLVKLGSKVSSSAHLDAHARLLIEYSVRRNIIELSERMRKEAQEGQQDALTQLDRFEQQLFDIGHANLKGDYAPLERLSEPVYERLRNPAENTFGGLTGLPSGFRSLDRYTGGWQPGDLIVLAARPSMGKTALALAMMRNAARDFQIPVGLFSMEMSATQLVERLMSSEAGVSSELFRQGNVSNEDMARLATDSVREVLQSPIFIDDAAALSALELRGKARRLCASKKLGCLVVDYLQLMSGDDRKMNQSREQEIASISRMLKATAKELQVPVIALSQLNREPEKRQSHKPMLSDIRDSGTIEQDADMVIFLYRPDYYGITEDANGQDCRGSVELIISKHRNGPTGSVCLQFNSSYGQFTDMGDPMQVANEASYHTMPSRLNEMENDKGFSNDEDPPF